MSYKNPILRGSYPDPSICCDGEFYYMVTSSIGFYPGIPIFKSRDLVNWEQIGHCLTRESQIASGSPDKRCRIFAPTIRYKDGVFYVITSNQQKGKLFFIYTDNPAGEWSEPVYLEQKGIDPSIYFEDGRVYVQSTERMGKTLAIIQSEIDIKTGKSLCEPRILWRGTGGKYLEGPHLYKVDNKYYLLAAEGGSEYAHRITMAVSDNIWGEYVSCANNPLATHVDAEAHIIQGIGHGDLIKDKSGKWWIVFLGFRISGMYFHHIGRETFLAPVEYINGEFVVNNNRNIELEMETEREVSAQIEEEVNNDFNQMYWNYIDYPDFSCYEITDKLLRLHGTDRTLSDLKPTFYGRRQQDFDCEVSVDAKLEKGCIGISAYYKEDAHYDIAFFKEDGKYYVSLIKQIGDNLIKFPAHEVYTDELCLFIKAEKKNYVFGFKNGSKETIIGSGLSRFLSTEVHNMDFMGVYLGMYATENGIGEFKNFKYGSDKK